MFVTCDFSIRCHAQELLEFECLCKFFINKNNLTVRLPRQTLRYLDIKNTTSLIILRSLSTLHPGHTCMQQSQFQYIIPKFLISFWISKNQWQRQHIRIYYIIIHTSGWININIKTVLISLFYDVFSS